jgi:hypothetical protein
MARLMNPLDMGLSSLYKVEGTSWQRLKSARLLHTRVERTPSWSVNHGEPTRLRKRTLSHGIEAHSLETIGMCDLELTSRRSAMCDLAGVGYQASVNILRSRASLDRSQWSGSNVSLTRARSIANLQDIGHEDSAIRSGLDLEADHLQTAS